MFRVMSIIGEGGKTDVKDCEQSPEGQHEARRWHDYELSSKSAAGGGRGIFLNAFGDVPMSIL